MKQRLLKSPARITTAFLILASLSLAGCGQVEAPSQSDAKALAQDALQAVSPIMKDAASVAGEVMDTRLMCQLAGQSAAFCGCLQSELGPKLAPEHVTAVTSILKASLDGSIQSALQTEGSGEASLLDSETQKGLLVCAARGAAVEALGVE
jgi:hypothetical protein